MSIDISCDLEISNTNHVAHNERKWGHGDIEDEIMPLLIITNCKKEVASSGGQLK